MRDTITPATLRELLRHEPETGKLFWRWRGEHFFAERIAGQAKASAARWNGRYAEKQAFTTMDNYGYFQGRVFDCGFRAHRIIWALHFGEWPQFEVDHINGDRADNRICNLREATHAENLCNRGVQSNSKSGIKGVSWCKVKRRWKAAINAPKHKHLGYFRCKAAAAEAYARASASLHGRFGRTA